MRATLGLVAFALAITAAPAAAAVRIAHFAGTLVSGLDQTGLFGTPGADLAGAAITASYRYDTALGLRNSNPGVSEEVFGGSYFGISSPVTNTRITINGISHDIASLTTSTAFTSLGFGIAFDSYDFEDNALFQTANGAGNFDVTTLAGFPSALDTLVAPRAVTLSNSYFQFTTFDKVNLVQSVRSYGEWEASATFSVTAVPEPASWALLLIGFGLVGGALRRRPAVTRPSASPTAPGDR